MIRSMRGRLARAGGPDAGISLVTVLFTFLALSALVLVTATYAANSARPAAEHVHWVQAEAAARSGIQDYLGRLNADPGSWLSPDCDNDAQRGQDPAVLPHSCAWDPDEVGWAPVETGTDPEEAPAFHYEVTAAPVEMDDEWASALTLVVTGRSNGVHRTLQTVIKRNTSADYVLYQDFDLVEGTTYAEGVGAATAAGLTDECGRGRGVGLTQPGTDRSGTCVNQAYFTHSDVLVGDVLMRDRAAFEAGAQIQGRYVTSRPECATATADPATWTACAEQRGGAEVEEFVGGVAPAYTAPRTLPASTAAYDDVPGCHYFGPTRIMGEGEWMRVWNDDTQEGVAEEGVVVSVAAPGRAAPDCGNLEDMRTEQGALVKVPEDLAVYVRTHMGFNVGDDPGQRTASYWSEMVQSFEGPVPELAPGQYPISRGPELLGAIELPPVESIGAPGQAWTRWWLDPEMIRDHKARRFGNLYIEGYFSPGSAASAGGRAGVTFIADESVVVLGDVLSNGASSTDHCRSAEFECSVGIVAGRSVEVFTPVWMGLRMWTEFSSGTPRPVIPDDVPLGIDNWTLAQVPDTTVEDGGAYHGKGFDSWPHRYVDHDRGVVYPSSGVQIQAAIQALTGSLYVQHHWAPGKVAGATSIDVAVQGSLATRFAGLLGPSRGYPELTYDGALVASPPPYLSPFTEHVPWESHVVTEMPTPDEVRS